MIWGSSRVLAGEACGGDRINPNDHPVEDNVPLQL